MGRARLRPAARHGRARRRPAAGRHDRAGGGGAQAGRHLHHPAGDHHLQAGRRRPLSADRAQPRQGARQAGLPGPCPLPRAGRRAGGARLRGGAADAPGVRQIGRRLHRRRLQRGVQRHRAGRGRGGRARLPDAAALRGPQPHRCHGPVARRADDDGVRHARLPRRARPGQFRGRPAQRHLRRLGRQPSARLRQLRQAVALSVAVVLRRQRQLLAQAAAGETVRRLHGRGRQGPLGRLRHLPGRFARHVRQPCRLAHLAAGGRRLPARAWPAQRPVPASTPASASADANQDTQ
ncbi:hypothetical protein LBM341_00049 [Ralstonia solanacearum]|nr:hypothetical protein LBM341_00049 [Ralstonia solanacearum]NKA16022.1 hypothetical protein [Ralstonia solanacearum]NKA51057.1 hypothetical protein [Ralstonia solanacearum]